MVILRENQSATQDQSFVISSPEDSNFVSEHALSPDISNPPDDYHSNIKLLGDDSFIDTY